MSKTTGKQESSSLVYFNKRKKGSSISIVKNNIEDISLYKNNFPLDKENNSVLNKFNTPYVKKSSNNIALNAFSKTIPDVSNKYFKNKEGKSSSVKFKTKYNDKLTADRFDLNSFKYKSRKSSNNISISKMNTINSVSNIVNSNSCIDNKNINSTFNNIINNNIDKKSSSNCVRFKSSSNSILGKNINSLKNNRKNNINLDINNKVSSNTVSNSLIINNENKRKQKTADDEDKIKSFLNESQKFRENIDFEKEKLNIKIVDEKYYDFNKITDNNTNNTNNLNNTKLLKFNLANSLNILTTYSNNTNNLKHPNNRFRKSHSTTIDKDILSFNFNFMGKNNIINAKYNDEERIIMSKSLEKAKNKTHKTNNITLKKLRLGFHNHIINSIFNSQLQLGLEETNVEATQLIAEISKLQSDLKEKLDENNSLIHEYVNLERNVKELNTKINKVKANIKEEKVRLYYKKFIYYYIYYQKAKDNCIGKINYTKNNINQLLTKTKTLKYSKNSKDNKDNKRILI